MQNETMTLIKALELEKSGKWDEAHRMVQVLSSKGACHVHAYLRRREGDRNNANYWYRRAGRPMPDIELDIEWQTLYDSFNT